MSLFSREPLTSLASFHLRPAGHDVGSEAGSAFANGSFDMYRLFPEDPHKAPDFIGQMAQMKSLFRTSAEIHEETSILVHKVGQYMILDQGPTLAPRNSPHDATEDDMPLTLVPFIAIEKYLGLDKTPRKRKLKGGDFPELPDIPKVKTIVKNTFIETIDTSGDESAPGRTRSCPARGSLQRSTRRNLPFLQQRDGLEELVVAQPTARHTSADEILVALSKENKALPPMPSRFGRAVEWRFGDYVILLGCDMTVYETSAPADYSNFCSFKLRSDGEFNPRKRLDNWLENLMCNIPNTVWYDNDHKSMYVERTDDLPDQSFDAAYIMDQSHRLFYFLQQHVQTNCGTYWLFRERNSSRVDLYDLSVACEKEEPCSTALRLPIASLCFRLARKSPDPIPLLCKGLRLLEPLKEEHSSIYAFASLELAAMLGSKEITIPRRLSLSLRHVEGVLSLRSAVEPVILHKAHVVHAESILKLVREVLIPLYTAALHCDEWTVETKQAVSVAGLLNRLAWLALANESINRLPEAQKQVEARVLVADILETFGDAAFALSRYPKEVHERVGLSCASSTAFLLDNMDAIARDHDHSDDYDIPGVGKLKEAVEYFRSLGSPLERNLPLDKRVREHELVSEANSTIWQSNTFDVVKALFVRAYKYDLSHVYAESKLRVGRKLAHVYNEEARKVMNDHAAAVGLFNQALAFMRENNDVENTAVVLINLAEVHFQRFLVTQDYSDAEACLECCRVAWEDCKIGQRDLAYYHMRVAVALDPPRAQKHLAKALKNFHTVKDPRECAVCHFHMAEFLKTNSTEAELVRGLRHARRSAEFWTAHADEYPTDAVQAALQVAYFQHTPKAALRTLATAETTLLAAWKSNSDVMEKHCNAEGTTVPDIRKVMGQICQKALKETANADLKLIYRKILTGETYTV